MVAGDRPPPWAVHEVDALARLDRARTCIDALLLGDWPADDAITDALAQLIASASPHMRLARELQAVA